MIALVEGVHSRRHSLSPHDYMRYTEAQFVLDTAKAATDAIPVAQLSQSPEAVTAMGQLLQAMSDMHCLCRELRETLAAQDTREGSSAEDSEPDTQELAQDPIPDLVDDSGDDDNSDDPGDEAGATVPNPNPSPAIAPSPQQEYETAIITVNVDGLPLELSELAIQTEIKAQKARKGTAKTVHKKTGKRGRSLCRVGPDFDFGDGTDGRIVVTAKQHRLASMLSDRTSIVMAQEVHLTQAQGQALLGLLRLNYPIDGDYAAGVPGAGRFRPREETAGVLTLWHTAMWKRLDGTAGNMGPSCAHPKGRILTSHLESLVDQSELHCTNAYAPQAGRGPSDAEEFGKGLLAIARMYVGLAPHVIGMDANGSVPGHAR